MKWLMALFSLALIAPYHSVCGQADTAQHWNLLLTAAYSIRYPPDWTANTTGVGGTSFALFAPTASHKAVFRQNINLVIKDVSADTVTLDELLSDDP